MLDLNNECFEIEDMYIMMESELKQLGLKNIFKRKMRRSFKVNVKSQNKKDVFYDFGKEHIIEVTISLIKRLNIEYPDY